MKSEMLLHRDRLLELKYSVEEDVLTILVDNFDNAQGSEVQHSFLKLSEALRFYDIKKVFIDLEHSSVHLRNDYKKLCVDVVLSGNVLTRIERVAWVALENWELAEKAICQCLMLQADKEAEFRGFQDRQEALSWLSGGNALR